MAYFPDSAAVRAVALDANLRNPHPSARTWLLEKIDRPPSDWDERAFLTVPGVVWSVSSDTCATGRLSAPNNVAYDDGHREFVFRQPRDEAELAAVMSADSEEVFACYRFDGLERWTSQSVDAWHADLDVVLGYARHALPHIGGAPDLQASLTNCVSYLVSNEFQQYMGALRSHLAAIGRAGSVTLRRG